MTGVRNYGVNSKFQFSEERLDAYTYPTICCNVQ